MPSVELVIAAVVSFWGERLAPLVSAVHRALSNLPLPRSVHDVTSLSREELLRLAPAAAIVATILITVVATVLPWRHGHRINPRTRGYWLTRLALTRMMGVVYAVAFATACHQMRPMYGEHGECTVAFSLPTSWSETSERWFRILRTFGAITVSFCLVAFLSSALTICGVTIFGNAETATVGVHPHTELHSYTLRIVHTSS